MIVLLMELLRAYKQTEVWFLELNPPCTFAPNFDTDFALMLWANEPAASKETRNAICDQIARSNCYYAVCGGESCEIWHDTIDECCVAADPNFSPPDSRFMMSTWHENDSVTEVLWVSLNCTPYVEARGPRPNVHRILVVFVGANAGAKEELQSALEKEFQKREEFNKLIADNTIDPFGAW